MMTAAQCGLVACPACGTITRLTLEQLSQPPKCQLCFARLHSRKPMSIQRSWAWPIALVVFLASVVVPVLKFVAVSYLLLSIQGGYQHSRYDRTRLFRLTEFIGRWSMIDVFVVAILAALVQIGSVAQIEPGLGATAFGATVIFTMLSALSLDPRLLWDTDQAKSDDFRYE